METKFCKTCSTEKDVSMFTKRVASKDGLDRMCIPCKSEYKKIQHEKHKERTNEIKRKKRLENPETYREQGKLNYQKHKEKRLEYTYQWQSKNQELSKSYKKKNYEINKEKYVKNALERYHTEEGKQKHKLRFQRYCQTEKGKLTNRIKRTRRKHVIDSTECNFTVEDWYNCLRCFENVCAYCGSSEYISQDHVIPVSKGGSFTPYNIIPACKSCNSSKSNKDFSDWYKTRPYYTDERYNKIVSYIKSPKGGIEINE